MRNFILALAAAGMLLPLAGAEARGPHQSREQDAAYRARQQGEILPLAAIRARVRVPGADFIGAEFNPGDLVYRLKFMRGGQVIFIDVDARSGRVLGRAF